MGEDFIHDTEYDEFAGTDVDSFGMTEYEEIIEETEESEMAGNTVEGKDGKVTIGATTVLGIGSWTYTPGAANELDDTEFGDTSEKILLGIRKRGTISFSGLAKKGDTTGQEVLKRAKINGTNLTNLRFYESDTSYYVANQTTGYFAPDSTTGNDTQPSYINITSFDIKSDKSGLGAITFSGTVSGDMVEV
jgi:hypothetical protein